MPQPIPESILTDGIKTDHLQNLQDIGRYLSTPERGGDRGAGNKAAMTTSQIRKFFGEIKRIQAGNFEEEKRNIILLDPKIAYAVGRAERGAKIKDFYDLVSPLIRKIKEDRGRFTNFVHIVEAIVAYHKAAGGK